MKSIDDYYQIIPLESALRSNKKINPLLLNQNNKLLNDKLKDLTDILYQVRKEKLAYKLKMSSFFNLKLYASNMISAIVEKKLILDDYRGPENNLLIQTRIQRLEKLWGYWVDTTNKYLISLLTTQRNHLSVIRDEILLTKRINASIKETIVDLELLQRENNKTLTKNISSIFKEHKYYLNLLRSNYRNGRSTPIFSILTIKREIES